MRVESVRRQSLLAAIVRARQRPLVARRRLVREHLGELREEALAELAPAARAPHLVVAVVQLPAGRRLVVGVGRVRLVGVGRLGLHFERRELLAAVRALERAEAALRRLMLFLVDLTQAANAAAVAALDDALRRPQVGLRRLRLGSHESYLLTQTATTEAGDDGEHLRRLWQRLGGTNIVNLQPQLCRRRLLDGGAHGYAAAVSGLDAEHIAARGLEANSVVSGTAREARTLQNKVVCVARHLRAAVVLLQYGRFDDTERR
mmetsp:Transcript_27314/g.94562  ORF Transcript_27314/g.94562 Transcript_27314/m.94562 type:complete len:261 (-) Transcript_27314:1659-2441(-)